MGTVRSGLVCLSVHLCDIPLIPPLARIWAASVLSSIMKRGCHSARLIKELVASSEFLGE